MTSRIAVFDTSVLIDLSRTGRHEERIDSINALVRISSIVLAELWRGATRDAEFIFLRAMEKNYPVLTATEKNWIESGQILGKMRADHGFTSGKLRDLHFDVLIALTARSHGARLITSNRGDFELIRHYRSFDLDVW